MNFYKDLKQLSTLETVESCYLDFGYECRITESDVVQTEFLPADFLRLAGTLDVGVYLSLFSAIAVTAEDSALAAEEG